MNVFTSYEADYRPFRVHLILFNVLWSSEHTTIKSLKLCIAIFSHVRFFFYSGILIHLIFIVQFSPFILLIRPAFFCAKVFFLENKKNRLRAINQWHFFRWNVVCFLVEKIESFQKRKNIGNIFRSEQIIKILRLRIFDFFNRCDKGVSYACHWVPSVMVHPSIPINTQYIGRKKNFARCLSPLNNKVKCRTQ